jgi:hypothetical protein
LRSSLVNVIGLVLAVSVVAALILAAVTKKVFHVEIEIAAPPKAVWAVLTDTERYAEWNPTQVEVRGAHAVGSHLVAVFDAPEIKPFEVQLTVIEMDSPRLLRQGGGVPGIITFDHRWMIFPTEHGSLVVQHEVDRGIYLLFWDSSWIEPAYQRASEALRARVNGLRTQEIRSNDPD